MSRTRPAMQEKKSSGSAAVAGESSSRGHSFWGECVRKWFWRSLFIVGGHASPCAGEERPSLFSDSGNNFSSFNPFAAALSSLSPAERYEAEFMGASEFLTRRVNAELQRAFEAGIPASQVYQYITLELQVRTGLRGGIFTFAFTPLPRPFPFPLPLRGASIACGKSTSNKGEGARWAGGTALRGGLCGQTCRTLRVKAGIESQSRHCACRGLRRQNASRMESSRQDMGKVECCKPHSNGVELCEWNRWAASARPNSRVAPRKAGSCRVSMDDPVFWNVFWKYSL